jgi:selenocysteine lyase/cysteine desulfurase
MSNTDQYDVASIRNDFPILGEKIHGKPLVYLDNVPLRNSTNRATPIFTAACTS